MMPPPLHLYDIRCKCFRTGVTMVTIWYILKFVNSFARRQHLFFFARQISSKPVQYSCEAKEIQVAQDRSREVRTISSCSLKLISTKIGRYTGCACRYELPTNLQYSTQKDLTEVKIFQKVLGGGGYFFETPGRSSVGLNCLIFEKITFLCTHFGDGQTNE